MGKWKRKIIRVFVVACFTIWLLSNCDMGVGGVLRQGSWEDAELILYDRWGNVVFKEGCDDRTKISYITDEIVEISHWFGSPFHYAYYYNVKTAECSLTDGPAYIDPVLIDYQYVAYWDYDKKVLVITDMFQKGLYYKEVQRDFSPTLDPTGLIRRFELTEDEENFIITYCSGEDYEEVEEIIPLWD